MGLDTYASRSPERVRLTYEDLVAFKEADIRLCVGLFSGVPGSFRGKVYNPIVEEVTGVSLYRGWIPPETVKAMAEALNGYEPQKLKKLAASKYEMDYRIEEIVDLQRFFKICAERGLGLIGEW